MIFLPSALEMHKRSVRARSRPGQKNPDFFITRSGRVFLKIGPDRAGLFQKYQAWFSYKKPGFFKNPDFIRIFLKILGLFQALGPGRARPGFFRIGFFRFFSRSDRIGFRISDFLNISTSQPLTKYISGLIHEYKTTEVLISSEIRGYSTLGYTAIFSLGFQVAANSNFLAAVQHRGCKFMLLSS